jgi:DNA-binding response OmpR family regulator
MAEILIVEDDDRYRNELATLVEKEGHKVYAARNGEAGLDILKKKHIDLVTLDLAMPKMDGITFYYYLEETFRTHIPVVIVTSATHAAYPSNVRDFINKTNVTLPEIVKRITQVLHEEGKTKS